jgi:hypothetical protein
MKKIILITFISLLTFVTVSHSKIYYFNKCYHDFKKNFSEMNMGQNSFIIDTEKKTVVNNQYRNDTNQSVTNKYNIEKIDNNIVRAINEKSKTFLINFTASLSFIKFNRK